MDNFTIYKLDVANKKVSEEIQKLLISIGFKWNFINEARIEHPFTYPISLYIRPQEHEYFCGFDGDAKVINTEQLKDMVVLNRNDPNDGNYSLFISDSLGHLNLYKTCNDVFYVFGERLKIWDKSRAVSINTAGLEPKGKVEKDQGLISWVDALRALADGKEVEFEHDKHGWVNCLGLNIEQVIGGLFKLRLKPKTIKLELGIPAPFEPKVGEDYFYINSCRDTGYAMKLHDGKQMDVEAIQFGAWRTEDEMKQVVSAFRKSIQGLSNA